MSKLDLSANPMALSDMMDFDVIVRVHENGDVTRHPEMDEPYFEVDEEEAEPILSTGALEDGWTFLTGFTGQHGYNGAVMHPSEVIAGGLAQHIVTIPGDYVSLVVEVEGEDYDPEIGERELVGWCIAYKPADDGTNGQDRESYTDDQDRDSYSCE